MMYGLWMSVKFECHLCYTVSALNGKRRKCARVSATHRAHRHDERPSSHLELSHFEEASASGTEALAPHPSKRLCTLKHVALVMADPAFLKRNLFNDPTDR